MIQLPLQRGATALVTAPGPRVAEIVHALTDQGVVVTVARTGDEPRDVAAILDDLASRGLVTLGGADNSTAEHTAFDLVVRDPAASADEHGPNCPIGAPEGDGTRTGRVVLVGGGPGDPGLLTVAGLEAIRTADVLVCDRLAPLGALTQARPDAEVIHVGKIPRGEYTSQERINELLVEHARAGRRVVRLKGGDSFVFGRGGEEWNACVEAGLPVSVIPGVTSSIAAPELAGFPVTHRHLTQGFTVVSGHVGPDDARSTVDWGALARSGMTLVVLMGVQELGAIAARLVSEGMPPSTPAASVADGGLPSMRSAVATLADIADVAAAQGISAPAVTIIGPTVDALHRAR